MLCFWKKYMIEEVMLSKTKKIKQWKYHQSLIVKTMRLTLILIRNFAWITIRLHIEKKYLSINASPQTTSFKLQQDATRWTIWFHNFPTSPSCSCMRGTVLRPRPSHCTITPAAHLAIASLSRWPHLTCPYKDTSPDIKYGKPLSDVRHPVSAGHLIAISTHTDRLHGAAY